MPKLTEKDKKLMVVLIVVLLVAGIGGQIVLPTLDKITAVRTELNDAIIEKSEKEVKVAALIGVENAMNTVEEELDEVSALYNKELLSKDVDEMLTKKAISYGVTVTALTISMPGRGESAYLMPYQGLEIAGESLSEDVDAAVEQTEYIGFSTVSATLRVSGERRILQALLDDLTGQTPAMRVDSFQWEESDGSSALSINLEIYMMKDIETYINDRQNAE